MKTVALVTYAQSPNLSQSDELIVKPLKKLGITGNAASWEDPKINWKRFDAVILRSCWNYYKYYPQFLEWLNSLESQQVRVFNHIDIVRWNSKKTYLRDLASRGVSIVPSVFVEKNQITNLKELMREKSWNNVVVKPLIGAEAQGVFRVKSTHDLFAQTKFNALVASSGAVVQPMMKEIMEIGEYSFVFLRGAFSHAVNKLPRKGEFRAQYYLGSTETLVKADASHIMQASEILTSSRADSLYARVDAIVKNGKLVLMELELIEPHLFLDLYPPAADTFARAINAMI